MTRINLSLLLGGVCLLFAVAVEGHAQKTSTGRTVGARPAASTPAEPESPATGEGLTASAPANLQATPQAIVPRLMKFNGVLRDVTGTPLSGAIDVTFALYTAEAGGEPLWFETQTVQADEQGRYTILLGAMHADGLPTDLFTSGAAHWLGVQVGLEAERPRVLLVSVPYALKAGDADTLGGKPASAYMLSEAQTTSASAATSTAPSSQSGNVQTGKSTKSTSPSAPTSTVVTPGGTANNLAKFFDSTTIVNSALFESGGNVGIGTSSPFYPLDVHASTNANLAIYAVGGSVFASAHNDMNTLQVPWAIYTSQLGLMGGKVGIGTTSPQGPVQVKTGQSASTQSLMIGGPNLMPAGVTFNSINDGNTANEPMELRASAFGFTQGNVGIGTATPQGPLQVKAGQSASTQSFMIGGPILMPAGVTLNSINDLNAANEPMELRASVFGLTQGNVGIGTITPGAMLNVNGTANFAGPVNFAAGQMVTGNVNSSGTGSFTGGLAVGGSFQVNSSGLITTPSVGAAALVPDRLNLSAAGFVCTNTATLTCSSTTAFNPAQGSADNGKGTWIANVALPQGTIVKALRVCGHDNDGSFDFTGNLKMAALTSGTSHPTAVVMATISSSGATDITQCFQTTTITNATIDNTANQYWVEVLLPADTVEFSTVQIDH